MEQNPIRIAEILLGLKDVNLLGIEDLIEGSIDIHVDRFGLDLIHSPSSVGVFEAEVAT